MEKIIVTKNLSNQIVQNALIFDKSSVYLIVNSDDSYSRETEKKILEKFKESGVKIKKENKKDFIMYEFDFFYNYDDVVFQDIKIQKEDDDKIKEKKFLEIFKRVYKQAGFNIYKQNEK